MAGRTAKATKKHANAPMHARQLYLGTVHPRRTRKRWKTCVCACVGLGTRWQQQGHWRAWPVLVGSCSGILCGLPVVACVRHTVVFPSVHTVTPCVRILRCCLTLGLCPCDTLARGVRGCGCVEAPVCASGAGDRELQCFGYVVYMCGVAVVPCLRVQ